jgi:hypothetical protein
MTEIVTIVNKNEAFILLIYEIILVSEGLFSVPGQQVMTEEKLHVSNYIQVD